VPAADQFQLPHARYLSPFVPAAAAALLVTTSSTRFAQRALSLAPLRALGALSYGFYVYHVACMLLLQRLYPTGRAVSAEHKLVFFVASVVLTVLVASISYLLIERPLFLRTARARGMRQGQPAAALP
jgi:peptidoglycan/LPS O-acetylase OafA/YrhL